jgi:hypothetical protein
MSSQNTVARAINPSAISQPSSPAAPHAATRTATLASPKSQDLLHHRGRVFQLLDQPLERYFKMIGQRPCEGEYTANWEIEDGWLYLTNLGCAKPHDQPMSMESLFPFAGRRVFAAWHSGPVRGFRTDRGDRLSALAAKENNHYPDLVLNLNCGRVETISVVHSTDRTQRFPAHSMSAQIGAQMGSQIGASLGSRIGSLADRRNPAASERAPLSHAANVLAFVPRTSDASWNPGWQGALV